MFQLDILINIASASYVLDVILENETEKEQSPPCKSAFKSINMHIQYEILGEKITACRCVIYSTSGFKTDVVWGKDVTMTNCRVT